MRRLGLAFLAAAAIGAAPARAAGDLGTEASIEACIFAAAEAHDLPPAVILILLEVEHGKLGEVSGNKNETVDIGPMQVNDTWLPKLAAHWRASTAQTYLALRDQFCANVEAGAWILRQALDEANGDFWEGVGLYHSHTEVHKTDYLRKVLRQALRLEKQASAKASVLPGGEAR